MLLVWKNFLLQVYTVNPENIASVIFNDFINPATLTSLYDNDLKFLTVPSETRWPSSTENFSTAALFPLSQALGIFRDLGTYFGRVVVVVAACPLSLLATDL